MVWKLFGKKKESAAAVAPETATSRDGDVLEDTTNTMVKVKQSMMDLQAK